MNEALLSSYDKEVKAALFQMAPLKSLKLNNFSACFYQPYWHVVGEEVCSTTLSFLNDSVFDESINSTYIVLIAKTSNPTRLSDFWPINLCNVIYKLISKVIVNRLKQILPRIVSSSHSAFILGRLITDNIIMAYKALHSIKVRQQGKDGNMAIKLDISKTYDRVE